jgi:phosphatidate cytidylyltransferase
MSTQNFIILGAVGGFFAAGAVVILLARFFGQRDHAQSGLWAIYLSEFLIVGALLLPAAAAEWIFSLFLVALCCRGQSEFVRLFGLSSFNQITLIGLAGGALAIAAPWFGYLREGLWLLVFAAAAMFVLCMLFLRGASRTTAIVANTGSLVFPALFCVAAALLRNEPTGFVWIFVVYATVEVNDSFALLCGKLFGSRHIFPKLSPGKTLEGLIAGILGGGLAGALLAHYLLGMPLVLAALLAAALLVAGIAGDLITSALKRSRGAKDFPPILKRHGGVLDIYDAFLFAAPAALVFQIYWNAAAQT